jgi:hypothetical protein
MVDRVANSDVSVLISGKRGVGELLGVSSSGMTGGLQRYSGDWLDAEAALSQGRLPTAGPRESDA